MKSEKPKASRTPRLQSCRLRSFFHRRWPEVVSFLAIVAIGIANAVCWRSAVSEWNMEGYDIVAVLMPMIVTIISIALSFPDKPIYGVSVSEFRKLKSATRYSFLEMIVLGIAVLAGYCLSVVFQLLLLGWALDLAAIVLSVSFACQEIPLLTHDDKRIRKIIRKNISTNPNPNSGGKSDGGSGVSPSGVENARVGTARIALQNFLLDKNGGIRAAYKIIKTDKGLEGPDCLDTLFDLQNSYLQEYVQRYSPLLQSSMSEYKGIPIVQAIDMSFQNVNDALSFDDDFNVVEIYGDSSHYYHLTRSLFFLNEISGKLKSAKVSQDLPSMLSSLFLRIDFKRLGEKEEGFVYGMLNAMAVYSLSNGELWFAESLRSVVARGECSDAYMVFVSIYLYYLADLESNAPEKLKGGITEFVSEAFSSQPRKSWLTALSRKFENESPQDIMSLLPALLAIFDSSGPNALWYDPSSSSDGIVEYFGAEAFTKALIVNCWVAFTVSNDRALFCLQAGDVQSLCLSKLSEEDGKLLAYELATRWFGEADDAKCGAPPGFRAFFSLGDQFDGALDKSPLLSALRGFKKKMYKAKIDKELDEAENKKTDFSRYAEILKNGFDNAASSFRYLDRSLSLSGGKEARFSVVADAELLDGPDGLMRHYANGMPGMLSRFMYDDFSKDEKMLQKRETIPGYGEAELKRILAFGPTATSVNLLMYPGPRSIASAETVEKITSCCKQWVMLPRGVFLKDGEKEKAIGANFEYLPGGRAVRPLTADEISKVVEGSFKRVNGLYRYEEEPGAGVLMSLDEISKAVSKRFFYICLAFKYRFDYRADKILYFNVDRNAKPGTKS